MAKRIPWTRDELLVAFRLYCRTPFGRLHHRNPEIIELAGLLGRTPSAVAMKACNFANVDPRQRARGIRALGNVSRMDRELWDRFQDDSESVGADAEAAHAQLTGSETSLSGDTEVALPDGPTEVNRIVRARRVQAFFRSAVLASYEYRCALSEIAVPELLNAGHIIPWKVNAARRADPCNGIALNALYDRAFDRGLMTFDESFRVVISPRLKRSNPPVFQRQAFLAIEGRALRQAQRFAPDPAAMEYHRMHIFA